MGAERTMMARLISASWSASSPASTAAPISASGELQGSVLPPVNQARTAMSSRATPAPTTDTNLRLFIRRYNDPGGESWHPMFTQPAP